MEIAEENYFESFITSVCQKSAKFVIRKTYVRQYLTIDVIFAQTTGLYLTLKFYCGAVILRFNDFNDKLLLYYVNFQNLACKLHVILKGFLATQLICFY